MNYKRKLISFFVFCLVTIASASPQTKYLTYLNGFGALKSSENSIERNNLIENNELSPIPKINLINFDCSKSTFDLHIRFANKNNVEGKSYKFKSNNDDKTLIKNPEWGFIWNYIDKDNYYIVKLKGGNTSPYDILDKRFLKASVISVCQGKEFVLASNDFFDGADLYTGNNVISVSYDGNSTYIYLGDKTLNLVTKLDNITYSDKMQIGYFVGAASQLEIERLVCSTNIIKDSRLKTTWTKESIDKYMQNTHLDNIEGYWSYLDRNLDNKKQRLGGKYTLAIIKRGADRYDILYYSGAKVNQSKWECGMLKGYITTTRFIGNYNLVWYDATMRKLNDDTYAIIDNILLTLKFPIGNGQIRFSKQK